jgi:Secretion system C-terminal sorting domain
MKNIILTLLVLLITSISVTAQTWTPAQFTRPEIIQYEPDWANDVLLSSTEPFGKITGAAKANGIIYVAVPDTAIQSGKSIVIFKSTDYGDTWTNFLSYSGTVMPQRSKMLRSGLDSVYYLYLINAIIYCLNVESNVLGSITVSAYRDFDAVASSTGSLYVVADALTSTSLPRYSTTNGFVSISQTGTVSTGSFPRMYMSGNGDTLILTFYQGTGTDTLAGTIRQGRYRESSPGQIASIAFLNVVTESGQKPDVQPVFYGGTVWMIYSLGTTGAIDIKCMLSSNSGVSYAAPVILAGNPNVDEYWFEARHYTSGTGGLDIAYYSDSLQSGSPTNNTDKMLYRFANLTTPTAFSSPVQFSEHIPGWSARMYVPAMVEIYNTSDVGVAWVGLDGTAKRVWWDRYSAISGIPGNQNETPQTFVLKQNYPNPFNPVTQIEFSIPKEEFVTLKVFDILGREAAVPLAKNMKAGKHTVRFDASKLSSGVYLYRIEAGRFTDAKKMILIK